MSNDKIKKLNKKISNEPKFTQQTHDLGKKTGITKKKKN
jgi:hypothetical protein